MLDDGPSPSEGGRPQDDLTAPLEPSSGPRTPAEAWDLVRFELRSRAYWWEKALLEFQEDEGGRSGGPVVQLREGLQDLGFSCHVGGRLEDEFTELAAHKASLCCFMLGCRSRFVKRCQEVLNAAQMVGAARERKLKKQKVSFIKEEDTSLDASLLSDTEEVPADSNIQEDQKSSCSWGLAAQRALSVSGFV